VAFTVDDFHDLISILEQHPEWRAELRRHVLSDELIELPTLVRQLAEAQARTEARMEQLAVAQARTEGHMEQLAVAQARTEARMEQLAEAQLHTEARLEQMLQVVSRMAVDVADLKGWALEARYQRFPGAYLGRHVRRAVPISAEALYRLLDPAVAEGRLTEDELAEIAQADVIARGRAIDTGEEVYMVVEVSWGVGLDDVQRAARRAALLGKAGLSSRAGVAGVWITPDAESITQQSGVAVIAGRVAAGLEPDSRG